MVDGIKFEIALDALTLRLPDKVKDGVCKFCDQPTGRSGLYCLSCLPDLASISYVEYGKIYNSLHAACGFGPAARRPASRSNVPTPPKPPKTTFVASVAVCDHCGALFNKSQPKKRFCSKKCNQIVEKRRARARKNPDYKPITIGVCWRCGSECKHKICEPCRKVSQSESRKRYRKKHGRTDRTKLKTKGVCRKCGKTCERYVCDVCQHDVVRWHRRKRRKGLIGGKSERYSNLEIAERDGWRCQLCKKKVDRRLKYPHVMSMSIDHIVPISQGGTDVRSNVQLAHLACNMSKGNRTLAEGEQLRLLG